MNEATKKTLSQLKELTDNEKHDARQKFARVKDAIEIYHVSRPTIMKMAAESGALYKIDATILINLPILDEYLETFRIPGVML